MEDETRNLAAVKVKSEELQIPYANLLPAFILEEIVFYISESEEADYFWLKDYSIFSLESYRGKAPFRLEYMLCSEEELTVQNVISRLDGIFQKEEIKKHCWQYQAEKIGNLIYVHLIGKIEELQIPIELVIERQTELELKPTKEELYLSLLNKKTEYLHYSVENLLSEHFIKILKNLELLGDLRSYDVIYHLLTKELNSTRKVTEYLKKLAEQCQVPIETERFEMICAYRESPYMKKQWKNYLRREKKKTPSFEEVLDILIAYFKPVWEALKNGSYYLGDWMPELKRYLD
ncbi:MAG: hypothetical protein HFI37_06425 [Lachnospiraceae bacterium]|nr:hypothetical protein [Lachnospiraceae bacterium]